MVKKQTAVEWLVEQLPLIQQEGLRDAIEQSKQMNKQQIIDAWKHGNLPTPLGRVLTPEQYYSETFKSE